MWWIISIVAITVITLVVMLLPKPENAGDPAKFERTFTVAEQETMNSRTVTATELKVADCKDGHSCWILVDGVVYDMSVFPEWLRGRHHGVEAGTDGTDKFLGSGHGVAVLQKMPVVGKMEQS